MLFFFFLFIYKKKGGRWIYSTKYCLKHDKQDIVQKPRGSTEDAAGMCPYTQHTHTDYTARWKKKSRKRERKWKDNSERRGEGGVFRASVRAPDHRTEKSRRSAPAAKSNPASSGKKKQKNKRILKLMQACYFEKWVKKNKIKKQTQLDCWGNWKALPHLSPRWCYLGKLCNRDPAGLRLWLFFSRIWTNKGVENTGETSQGPWND